VKTTIAAIADQSFALIAEHQTATAKSWLFRKGYAVVTLPCGKNPRIKFLAIVCDFSGGTANHSGNNA
jgi:hypothetical protein